MDIHRSVAVAMVGTLAAGSVCAAESHWYIGLSGGSSSSNISKDQLGELARNAFTVAGLNVQTIGTTTDFDDTDTAWALRGGYRISRYVSLEAAYLDLGSVSAGYAGQVGRVGGTRIPPLPVVLGPGSSTVDIVNSGFSFSGLVSVPFADRFDVHAHVGLLLSTTEISTSGNATGASVQFSNSVEKSGEALFYGLGAGVRLGSRWTLSLDWERFNDVGIDQETLEQSGLGATQDLEADYEVIRLSLTLNL